MTMKEILLLLVIFVFPHLAVAATTTLDVGGTSIVIPYPTGFAPVTAEFVTLNKMLDSFVPSTNKRFVSFFDERQMGAVLKDEIPDSTRTFNIQTLRALVDRAVTKEYFVQFKEFLKKQNLDVIKQVEQQMPGIMDQINKNIEKQFDVDAGLKTVNMIPCRFMKRVTALLAIPYLLSNRFPKRRKNRKLT
jgi:hypothetical protein